MSFVRLIPLCSELGVSPATLWRWAKAKKFPAPVKLGPNTTAWNRDEIDRWKQQRIAASRSTSEPAAA